MYNSPGGTKPEEELTDKSEGEITLPRAHKKNETRSQGVEASHTNELDKSNKGTTQKRTNELPGMLDRCSSRQGAGRYDVRDIICVLVGEDASLLGAFRKLGPD